ncbi:MAG TPA: DNA ligase [Verrucomicrobiales bacterium]|nr:DNA ligase [Verrucomicrobiales bacterium]HIL72280.1 DNA ligase [Verrucomicrobiota bacterium]
MEVKRCRYVALLIFFSLISDWFQPVALSFEKLTEDSVKKKNDPALLLAKTWDHSIDPTGWWISEKYDGIRAYWDGKAMWTRAGNKIHLPEYCQSKLPQDMALDGELWMGRGKFEETVSTVRRRMPDERWKQVKFMVFDVPNVKGTFEHRLKIIIQTLPINSGFAIPVPQYRCKGTDHLISNLNRIVKTGGEGLMIRKPESEYETHRSPTLLKVKPYDDAEATVIGQSPGKGKFAGMMGSLQVITPEGLQFSLGTGLTIAERKSPPDIGTKVTYRYRGFTKNGIPRFPSFLRVRRD